MEAYSSGAIKYSGESAPIIMIGYLFLRLCDYAGFHPWLGREADGKEKSEEL